MSGGGDDAAEQSVKTGESPNQADEEGNKQAGAIETAKVSQDTVAGERTETFQCAVCYEDHNLGELARMPCCFVEGSSTNFCKSCVQVICEQGIDGRLGKCPKCSQWFTVEHGNIRKGGAAGTCRMQPKELADPAQRLCEPCVLGTRLRLRYECERCHRVQRIPHPMFRYQESPEAFSTVTWACHVACGDYTNWRGGADGGAAGEGDYNGVYEQGYMTWGGYRCAIM